MGRHRGCTSGRNRRTASSESQVKRGVWSRTVQRLIFCSFYRPLFLVWTARCHTFLLSPTLMLLLATPPPNPPHRPPVSSFPPPQTFSPAMLSFLFSKLYNFNSPRLITLSPGTRSTALSVTAQHCMRSPGVVFHRLGVAFVWSRLSTPAREGELCLLQEKRGDAEGLGLIATVLGFPRVSLVSRSDRIVRVRLRLVRAQQPSHYRRVESCGVVRLGASALALRYV